MINPIAFQIGNISIYWYGIIMALAFFIGAYIAIYLAKFRNISKNDVLDFTVWLIVAGIVGARLGHVISAWSYYSQNLTDIFKIWNGGLAFHTGFFLVIIAAIIFSKVKKINLFDLLDIFVIPLALGLGIGRIGNLINREILGKVTNLPWGMYIDGIKRHPSQIYELITNVGIFSYLFYLFKTKKLPSGFIFWSFLAIYSPIRFFLDFFKDWAPVFLNLSWAQLFSIPLFIIAIIMLIKIRVNLSFQDFEK